MFISRSMQSIEIMPKKCQKNFGKGEFDSIEVFITNKMTI